MTTLFTADQVIGSEVIDKGCIAVDDTGSITYVGGVAQAPAAHQRIALAGAALVPGFIDIHVHGGHGIAFGTPGSLEQDLHAYSAWVPSTGVTGFLLSIAAPTLEDLLDIVMVYADLLETGGFPGAIPVGLHLEGPFLNPIKRGAFNPRWLSDPSLDAMRRLLEAGRGWVRQVTLAPELPDALAIAKVLRDAGVVASMGHTNADYAFASEALAGDFTHVTHTFNAQRGFHHRDPGVLGAVLGSDGVTAELIADLVHVHPGAMKVMLRCLGTERTVLVTDAMAAAGMADGTYELVGRTVTVTDGEARNSNGTLAGSTAALNTCVANVQRELGVSLEEAVRMASANPARAMGLDVNTLSVGQPANVTALNAEGDVLLTLVNGQVVYQC